MAEKTANKRSEAANTLLAQLKNPFDPRFVKCRIGARTKDKSKGIALFYIDAREVMKRLDDVCGMEGWSRREEAIVANDKIIGMVCSLSIRMPYQDIKGNDVWCSKSDAGDATQVAPVKGASSDSFKRAAVNFGIGRYLYYIPNQWYELKNNGSSFSTQPQLPKWALPQNDLTDWEEAAIKEYNPETDIDVLDNPDIDFNDIETEELLKESQKKRQEILERAGKKIERAIKE